MRSSWSSGSSRWLLAAAFAAGTFAAHRAMPTAGRLGDDERFVPRPALARALAFGFETVVADFHWLQAVQIVGGTKGHPSRQAPMLGRLVDVATTLDPWVDHPYRFAAIWLTDSVESVQLANRLLRRGVSYHPRDWRNRFYLGFNHFFYLSENEAAAEALAGAIEVGGTPRYLQRLVARLRADTQGLGTAELFLRKLVQETEDPYARAEYEKALDEIETERRARKLDAARQEFLRRHGRDLERVEDLVRGPDPVLRKLPKEIHGWEWVIDPETNRIVSSWYGARYELRFQGSDPVREQTASGSLGTEERL
jgi:hypothetical protein